MLDINLSLFSHLPTYIKWIKGRNKWRVKDMWQGEEGEMEWTTHNEDLTFVEFRLLQIYFSFQFASPQVWGTWRHLVPFPTQSH